MIFGDCPYEDCAGSLIIPLATGALPKFERHKCDTCLRWIWTQHSRWDAWSLSEEQFLKQYTVDEATHRIALKPPSLSS